MNNRTWLRHVVAGEDGGLMFPMLLICFTLCLFLPFLWDVGSVRYARRFAQTGADAASLAAAQEYARQLQFDPAVQGRFEGSCELGEFTPQAVVARYLSLPAFAAPTDGSAAYASFYAGANRNTIRSYVAWPEHGGRVVDDVAVPWIKVFVATERPAFTAYTPLYGREFAVENTSQAVAFLDTWDRTSRPCFGWISTTVELSAEEIEQQVLNCSDQFPDDNQQRQACETQAQQTTTRTEQVWGVIGETYDYTFLWKITLDTRPQ